MTAILCTIAGILIGGGLVGIAMRYRGRAQEAQITSLLDAANLGMPEDPNEEIAEEKLPPLEELFVPVPPVARYGGVEGLARIQTYGETLPEPEPPLDPEPTEDDLKKLGVDPADEALDRELFMTDQPRVQEE
jgi:hypothetical protein